MSLTHIESTRSSLAETARRRVIPALVLSAIFAACGGSSGGSGTVDQADAFASARVCNGEPSDVAPDDSTPASGYVYLNAGGGWSADWFGTFGDDGAVVGDDASDIVCATVTESSEGERCEFEKDGDSFTLIMMEATYDLELRRAGSGNVIARDEGTVPGSGCPVSAAWTEGEGERQSFAPPTEALERMLGPFFG